MLGVPGDPIQLNVFPFVCGQRSIYGSLSGTPIDSEDALAFRVLENICPMIETASLDQAADSSTRGKQGRNEYVIKTKEKRNYRAPSGF